MSTEIYEQTFEVGTTARLKVSNLRGHIDIQPGEEGIIKVKAEKNIDSGNSNKTQIKIEQESDGVVVAEATHNNSITNWFSLNKPCRVDFTIQVPQACSVNVNCVSSSASIFGVEGNFDIHGVSGDIKLSNLSGEFDLNSVSGKITAEHLTGPLELNNVSGKIHITDSIIPSMIGKTVSGNTIIETPLTEGPYEFRTVSGNMSVITPDDTACTIYIKSLSGKAKVNLPVTSRSGVRNKQVIEVAGGGPKVSLNSVSGVLKVGSSNYEAVETESTQTDFEKDAPSNDVALNVEMDSPDEASSPPKTQMQILQDIEKGEISVDEALKQLNP